MVDWVVEHPQAPQPEAEPAWMILRRMENELAEPAVPPAEAQVDVSMPLPSMPPQTAPPSPATEPVLVVAETVSQLAEELRPTSMLPPPELAVRTKLSAADPLAASPAKQLKSEQPSTLMQRAAAVVAAPRAAAAKADDKPTEPDPDDFLFAPDEKIPPSATSPVQQQTEQPEPAPPEPETEPEPAKNSDHDPLSPLRAMSDAQKIALFS
jgi:hypothetical protein